MFMINYSINTISQLLLFVVVCCCCCCLLLLFVVICCGSGTLRMNYCQLITHIKNNINAQILPQATLTVPTTTVVMSRCKYSKLKYMHYLCTSVLQYIALVSYWFIMGGGCCCCCLLLSRAERWRRWRHRQDKTKKDNQSKKQTQHKKVLNFQFVFAWVWDKTWSVTQQLFSVVLANAARSGNGQHRTIWSVVLAAAVGQCARSKTTKLPRCSTSAAMSFLTAMLQISNSCQGRQTPSTASTLPVLYFC